VAIQRTAPEGSYARRLQTVVVDVMPALKTVVRMRCSFSLNIRRCTIARLHASELAFQLAALGRKAAVGKLHLESRSELP